MRLAAGSRLGAYEVVRLIGSGGMGEVYEARDIRLGRLVALKLLPAEVAADPERLARLEREARTVAALNHPNIVSLFAIEQSQDAPFLVMERVNGRSLAEIVEPGGLSVGRILELAVPIADALAAAHERGIVHRDLKPANVMVDDDGRVKVLDFGLARANPTSPLSDQATEVTQAITEDGRILGTVPYMAPEQLRGERVDGRADLFAFGTMLYEMASGTRPFRGASSAEVVAAILRETPPPLDQVRPGLPASLVRIVQRCLEKDPRRRMQSAVDLRHELQDVAEELRTTPSGIDAPAVSPTPPSSGAQSPRRRRVWPLVAAAAAIVAIAVAAALFFPYLRLARRAAGSAAEIRSLAVLPFDNQTHDASEDYFVEGLHEALITDLAKLGAVRVTSRNSVMRYKGRPMPLKDVARELDVDALIEGSVLRVGDRVRITAQLILGRTDEHVWAESYDRDMRDVLNLLSQVSRAIAAEVQTRVAGGGQPAPLAEPTATHRVVPEAYEAYLRGRHIFLRVMTEPRTARQALDEFQQAVTLDPQLADAWSGLAIADLLIAFFRLAPTSDVLPQTREAARRAIALDDRQGEAWGVLGSLDLFFEWNFDSAKSNLERGIKLSPHDAILRHSYADYLMVTGRVEDSFAQTQLARLADPESPVVQLTWLWHAIAARHYDEALTEGRRMAAAMPSVQMVHACLGDVLWLQGKYEEALAEYRLEAGPESAEARRMDEAFRRAGPRAAIRAQADYLAEHAQEVNAFTIAEAYAQAGARDQAFDWLNRAYADRRPQLLHVVAWPFFDDMRSDPRYQDLIRRIGIPLAR